jgi:hypothetical protein
MKNIDIYMADVIEWAEKYEGEPFHALLCDPPYELAFMNAKWDSTGISFRKETWEAFYRVLYPGAFGMAFGGSRTAHRIAVAIEDAGFIIHPFCGWAFGSGFPKATRIDTQVDKAAGVEREVVEHREDGVSTSGISTKRPTKNEGIWIGEYDVTAPSTDLAKVWVGHRYGKQALKPAFEPIIVFQKPYEGKPVDCITRTGAGAMNIDGSRIGTDTDLGRMNKPGQNGWKNSSGGPSNAMLTGIAGRWPANFVLTHSPDCTESNCVDGCAVKAMGEQGGISNGSFCKPTVCDENANTWGGTFQVNRGERDFDDSGTVARFFHNSDWMYERLEEQDGFFYCAKANGKERNAGLEGERANIHPSVKPVKLIEHLAKLLLPPDMYLPRRLLVPFAGSGSEMIGAFLAGWETIAGIEKELNYCQIAKLRLEYWRSKPTQCILPNLDSPKDR